MNDSIDLLKSEIAKEEALLASEKKALQEMDKNAKRADAERKRQMKKVRELLHISKQLRANCLLQEHPVLRQLDNPKEAQDGQSSEFTLADAKNSQINLDDV